MREPDQNPLWRTLSNSVLLRFLLLFASGWALVLLIEYFYTVIAMFATAAILAVLMDFPTRQFSRYLPRSWAIGLTIVSTLAIATAFITILGIQILDQGRGLLDSLTTALSNSNLPFKNFLEQININQITQVIQSGLNTGLGVVGSVFSNTFTAIFVLVIAVYMLVDGKTIWSTCLGIIPASHRDQFDQNVKKNFLGFLRAQFILICFLSIASFLVFTVLQVNFSLVLAIIVGVLDAIPGIGATLGVLIITAIVFLTQGPWIAVKVVIASIILQQIQDNYVQPKVMKQALKINPVLLFLSLFIGERIAGILGIFLAVPIAGMLVTWLKPHEENQENQSTGEHPREDQGEHPRED